MKNRSKKLISLMCTILGFMSHGNISDIKGISSTNSILNRQYKECKYDDPNWKLLSTGYIFESDAKCALVFKDTDHRDYINNAMSRARLDRYIFAKEYDNFKKEADILSQIIGDTIKYIKENYYAIGSKKKLVIFKEYGIFCNKKELGELYSKWEEVLYKFFCYVRCKKENKDINEMKKALYEIKDKLNILPDELREKFTKTFNSLTS